MSNYYMTLAQRLLRFMYRIGRPIYARFRLNRIGWLNQFAFLLIRYIMTVHYRLEMSLRRFVGPENENLASGWSLIGNVEVTGGSRLIIKENVGYIPILQDESLWQELARYKLQEEAQMLFRINRARHMVSLWPLTAARQIESRCFSALSPFSKSWVHWLFEMVPQLLELSALPDCNDIKILIEPKAPAQVLETITLFFPSDNIFEIKDREQARCEQLLLYDNPHPSWSVLWTRDVHDKSTEHYHHDFAALQKVRHAVYAKFGISEAAPEKNLFIRRKAAFRFIHNEEELAALLTEQQFAVIEPSSMSFREQVQCFSDTKMIVAQAGAALANIMFMKPGSSVVCLAADSPYLNYNYFQSIADAFGVTLYYVLGAVDDPKNYCHTRHLSTQHPLNASFTIDKTELAAVLKEKIA